VAAVLDATDTPPALLTLEQTESVFVRDPERALVVLKDLKDFGVKLALDDFGTGYSSLN
jgi:EAL domain-containing protein (putative c-di-GMP-specific phosphodiesterase class I)